MWMGTYSRDDEYDPDGDDEVDAVVEGMVIGVEGDIAIEL